MFQYSTRLRKFGQASAHDHGVFDKTMIGRFNEADSKETLMLKAKIQADVKEAMKAGNAADRDTLRLLLAELLNEEKKTGAELSSRGRRLSRTLNAA